MKFLNDKKWFDDGFDKGFKVGKQEA